ncbi:leucine-rich repeat-containing protein 71-like [Haliotis rubra]|uniref:leucine-rich repeat-containing protein 71-like n=1 Tax=Haliotis rubra TaxID=36100 RepID=UPI001EE5BF45|nr:leucine-rich repeat-containing protein 71-like [Haliotis rubra]
MEAAEYIPELQNLLLAGNRILVNLNLARNRITDVGVMELTKAVQYQTTLSLEKKIYSLDNKHTGTGLMRICLHKNKMSPDSNELKKLNDMMATKHPFYKPPATPASSIGGQE